MTAVNTSATGGYLQPTGPAPLPGNLTFKEFIQQVFVGVSGLPGELVRPKWQINPPKQPDVTTNWMAIGLTEGLQDTNAYTGVDSEGNNVFERNKDFQIQASFYGPNADDFADLVSDNFQIPQNLESLRLARMGFVNTSRSTHVPDLVNERWVDRYEMTFFFRRQILRSYQILTFLSVNGTLTAEMSGTTKTVAWNTPANE